MGKANCNTISERKYNRVYEKLRERNELDKVDRYDFESACCKLFDNHITTDNMVYKTIGVVLTTKNKKYVKLAHFLSGANSIQYKTECYTYSELSDDYVIQHMTDCVYNTVYVYAFRHQTGLTRKHEHMLNYKIAVGWPRVSVKKIDFLQGETV